jgi:hypothetical protein
MMIGEFEQRLRSRTNQEKRSFQEETVVAYAKAARAPCGTCSPGWRPSTTIPTRTPTS